MSNSIFPSVCKASSIPEPVSEFRFHQTRRWKFDWAWPDKRVALEVEGGVWTGGRHTRGAGFLRDMEKYNAATVQGWRILRTTPSELLSRDTINMVAAALSQ